MKTSICLSVLPAPQAAKRSMHCATPSQALLERFKMFKPSRADTPNYALSDHLHVQFFTLQQEHPKKRRKFTQILQGQPIGWLVLLQLSEIPLICSDKRNKNPTTASAPTCSSPSTTSWRRNQNTSYQYSALQLFWWIWSWFTGSWTFK